MKQLLIQLLKEVREAGGTTAQLLNTIPNDQPEFDIINEMDSYLSIWEDQLEEMIEAA